MSKFMELVKEVVQSGISVTLEFDHTEGKIYADLNFNAKSHGYFVRVGRWKLSCQNEV